MTRGCVGRRALFLACAAVAGMVGAEAVRAETYATVTAYLDDKGYHFVDPSGDLHNADSLQSIVGRVSDGGTLKLNGGVYSLSRVLCLNRSITIQRASADSEVWLECGVVDKQTGPAFDGVHIKGNNVRLEGLGIRDFKSGIVVSGADAKIQGNTIGGNWADGIQVTGSAASATINGNRIGVGIAGSSMLDNGRNGIAVGGGAKAYIGNGDVSARNVVAANGYNGILVSGDSTAEIIGNYVGLGSDGKVITYDNEGSKTPGGNRGSGISVEKSNAIIDRNVISGNHTGGITLADAKSVSITKNLIGTEASGLRPAFINEINKAAFGNGGEGIAVRSDENNSTGKVREGNSAGMVVEGNTIAYSAGNGVSVEDPTTIIPIRGNSIFGSGTLGIDVLADGYVTPEIDSKTGGKTGALNFPMIETVDLDGSRLNVRGYLDTECSGDLFTLDFFANAVPDTYGYGEGQTYLGSWTLTGSHGTDGHRFAFDARLPINSVLTRQRYLTATATDASGHTSEFSLAIEIKDSISTIVPLPSPALMSLGGLGVLAGVHVVRGRRRRVGR